MTELIGLKKTFLQDFLANPTAKVMKEGANFNKRICEVHLHL